MRGLSRRIMEHAESLPEATPLCPAALLHLGKQAAVHQALSRLARSGHLMRICQGIYVAPDRDPLRRSGAPGRQGDRRAVADVGRNDSAVWRRRSQLPAPHHAESGAHRLSHLRSQPQAALRQVHRRVASRSHAGNWRRRTAGPETSSALWHGSVPKRLRTASK